MSEKMHQNIDIPEENKQKEKVDIGRRRLVKGMLAGVALYGLGKGDEMLNEGENEEQEDEVPILSENNKIEEEQVGESLESQKALTPFEQLENDGEITDIESGLEAYERAHMAKYIEDEDSTPDMVAVRDNAQQYDIKKLMDPFDDKKLPRELAYMLPAQETRLEEGVESPTGATSIFGIMPKTALQAGYTEEDLKTPEGAAFVAADLLSKERDDRFGDDLNLVLAAYNAGGGLFGYTKVSKSKKYRNNRGFLEYMQNKINEDFKEILNKIENDKFYTYRVTSKDYTPRRLCERLDISLPKFVVINNYNEDTQLKRGEIVKIPSNDAKKESAQIMKKKNWKYFEALNYPVEIQAKYKALQELGLLEDIDPSKKGKKKVELAMN